MKNQDAPHRLLRVVCTALALCLSACGDGSDESVPPTTTRTVTPTITPTSTTEVSTPTATPTFAGNQVTVHVDERMGPVNSQLLGVGWNTGRLDALGAFVAPTVRIDSNLSDISPAPGEWHLDGLLAAVAAVRAAGSQPLVILYPMPEWLGQPNVAGCVPPTLTTQCNPRFVAPADSDAWENVIAHVVRTVATAPQPALRFEVWNEPDGSTFWQDTREAFFRTAVSTHRAVARVATETGLPIEIGGPAGTLIDLNRPLRPTFDFLTAYVDAILAAGQPLHFISWHWYANTPLLGPDGNEGFLSDDIYQLLAGINPRSTPHVYGDITEKIRVAAAPKFAAPRIMPALVMDEWNLSAGGFDRRNDSHIGAAFTAASLIEMERADLDEANIYRAVSGAGHAGDWGIVGPNGEHKPNWWVFWGWQQMAGERVRVDGDAPTNGLWARAVRGADNTHIVLATFRAAGTSDRAIELVLSGACAADRAEVFTLDTTSASFEHSSEFPVVSKRLSLQLGDQSVTWVRMRCG